MTPTGYQTLNIALVGPIADFVISINLDGSIQTQGTDISRLLEIYPNPISEVEDDEDDEKIKALKDQNQEMEPASKATSDGKLVVAEEIVEGHIAWKSMSLLLSALGGNYPVLFFVVVVGWLLVATALVTAQTWFLGVWGSQYENHAASDVRLSL